MLKRYGRVVAAIGGLAVAVALAGHAAGQSIGQSPDQKPATKVQDSLQPNPPGEEKAKAPSAGCEGAKAGEDAQLCFERRAVEAAEHQAYEADRSGRFLVRNFWLGTVQAVATILSVFFTAWAAVAAARAARSAQVAADAIPVLERADLFSEVVSASINSAIEGALRPSLRLDACPSVILRFKNFGKTPASLSSGEIFITYTGPGARLEGSGSSAWPVNNRHVLAAGESTDEVHWHLGDDLNRRQAEALKSGAGKLRVWGWMVYLDVWEREHECAVGWTYSAFFQRLIPDDPMRVREHRKKVQEEKPRAALLTRLRPSYWWPYRNY
jgi:hypothetical protein